MPDPTQYLTLGLGEEMFGINIRHVHEILDMQPIAALPHAPPFLLGMTDVRGAGTPVVDLRTKLGLPHAAMTPATRIMILHVPVLGRTTAVGFVADRVFEVTTLDDDRLEPPPEVGGQWQSTTIAGIGRKRGGFVVVFDLERLMALDAVVLQVQPPTAVAA